MPTANQFYNFEILYKYLFIGLGASKCFSIIVYIFFICVNVDIFNSNDLLSTHFNRYKSTEEETVLKLFIY